MPTATANACEDCLRFSSDAYENCPINQIASEKGEELPTECKYFLPIG